MHCAAREPKRRGAVQPPGLLRVELDDELFLYRERDVLALRCTDDPTNSVLFVKGQPLGNLRPRAGSQGFLDWEEVQVLSPHRNLISHSNVIAGNVDHPPIHLDMPMPYDLPGLGPT